MKKFVAAVAAALLVAAPLAALAQSGPSYSSPSDDSQIRGRITYFDGGYELKVHDEKGYIDNVRLHQGTIINPRGLTLEPGMTVSILGYNAGRFFAANEVDTPYVYYEGSPYYGGHPWDYYGPQYSLGFFFGSPGWWHGDGFDGDYHYDRGARSYDRARVNSVYRGGSFQGRDYIAPADHGGYQGHAAHVDPSHDSHDRH